ncbi:hypothetical protein M405DRAFT_830790 [Rhizopogon salebrosus TDB-379]|nr:hypothetical protein M405DRAFT_830790 [Rhizopogon salebrosus TDB-379]
MSAILTSWTITTFRSAPPSPMPLQGERRAPFQPLQTFIFRLLAWPEEFLVAIKTMRRSSFPSSTSLQRAVRCSACISQHDHRGRLWQAEYLSCNRCPQQSAQFHATRKCISPVFCPTSSSSCGINDSESL